MTKKKRSYKRKATAEIKPEVVSDHVAPGLIMDVPIKRESDTTVEPLPQSDHEAVLRTMQAQPQDRMMHYARNPRCPKCDAHPVVCMMRLPTYKKFRCRECGHMWEVKG